MADANAQRLVIKIVGDTSELEASLSKIKSTAATIVGSGSSGATPGAPLGTPTPPPPDPSLSAAAAKAGLDKLSLRIAGLRRESKAAGMDIYKNIGNPFLVISSLSQRITGIYQLTQDAEKARMKLEGINDELQIAKRAGDETQVIKLTESANDAANEVDKLNKKMTSFGTRLRGVGDFFVNQFMTAGLFGFFQVNAMIIQGLATAGLSMVRSLVDPIGVARDRAKELADLVNKFGGTKKLALALDMSDEDRKTLEAAVRVAESQTAFERRLAAEKGITETKGLTAGAYTEDQVKKLRMEEAMRVLGSKGFEAEMLRFFGWDATFGGPGHETGDQSARNAGLAITPQSLAKQAQLDYARQLVEVARENGSLDEEQRKTLQEVYGIEGKRLLQAYDFIKVEKSRTTELERQRDELERQRFMLTGNNAGLGEGAGAELDAVSIKIKASQDRAAKYQSQLDSMAAAEQRRQIARTVGEARSELVRAGVARAGVSGFEMAAGILEARQRFNEAREQAAQQRRQSVLMEKIARESAKQNDYNKQIDIIRNGMELAMANWELQLTIDPAADNRLAARFRPAIDRLNRFNIPS
ncbi:hypothetical protein UFOVP1476_38 [uncultured Caudovirales phage]|uniref:Uncharacterized protein n=1 Tax=uncultured Caudovirales phage TaxID=2100421 RepID=A0A6J5RXA4_9CAUD|nr:hypothetical protein UFOVP944_8 [uncultured Caudovirales phage]CAB4203256.1 hypothetical protein UFOVP1381_12 [uncultured Caudovirales phage]CAB4216095.1 hypothetical protein UFOVP1476_38 [uncultured Caudovirales phage]